jgi:arylsulfatase A-like enzyme
MKVLNQRGLAIISLMAVCFVFCSDCDARQGSENRPHIVLVMADDQGWGQTGYYGHPFLKTPHLDDMAAHGLRLDRFYAGGPVCSPTRATVLTGRTHERTGVMSHGYPLRLQEKTIPQALAEVGYVTSHFGKWHLNGIRGAGIPILPNDDRRPDAFGFSHWLSVTNFFDMHPLMGRYGKPAGDFEKKRGDSSEVVVMEAIHFLKEQINKSPDVLTFTVIWFGTPHSPWASLESDSQQFPQLSFQAQRHYGELVAMDRSIGALRSGLQELGIADNTLLWFSSDNGGLPNKDFQPTVGQLNKAIDGMVPLRGSKGTLYEGGVRVPSIVEWPSRIEPKVSQFQAGAVDIFPTILEVVGLPEETMLPVHDGISLCQLFDGESNNRNKPMGFRWNGGGAWINGRYKLVVLNNLKNKKKGKQEKESQELFDLVADPTESKSIAQERPAIFQKLMREYAQFSQSIDESIRGRDYPSGKLENPDPEPKRWSADETIYTPFLKVFEEEQELLDKLTNPDKAD